MCSGRDNCTCNPQRVTLLTIRENIRTALEMSVDPFARAKLAVAMDALRRPTLIRRIKWVILMLQDEVIQARAEGLRGYANILDRTVNDLNPYPEV